MNKRTVVVVDDDAGDQMLLRMAFEQNDIQHHLKFFSSGSDALDYLLGEAQPMSNRSELVSLVMVDFNMPGMKGDEVIARLRQDSRTSVLPAIMLSGSSRDADVLSAYEKGANSYLRKPLDFEEFAAMIRSAIEFWLGYNLLPNRGVI